MKWWIRIGLATGTLALAATLIPMFATARHADVRDPNDVKGLLDVRRVEMVAGKARWKVTSWRGWKTAELWDAGNVLVYVDSFGSSRADYYVLVSSNGRKMTGVLYRDRQRKDDRRIRSVRVRHPNATSVNATIPMGKLRRRGSGIYGWFVLTLFSGPDCRQVCFDRAPNSGSVTEPGPRPTPTLPTPTPTVTPTPTPTPTSTS
jgi:hypothetical protein